MKASVFRKVRFVIATAVFAVVASACGVTLKDLTPASYPYSPPELLDKSPYLFANSSPTAIIARFQGAERGFYLEAKPKTLTSIRGASVIVNGTAHEMEKIAGPSRGGLYFFDASCVCQESLDYFFNVRIRNFLQNTSEKLGSNVNTSEVTAEGWGHMYWYRPGYPIHLDDASDPPILIKLDRQTGASSQTFIIENMLQQRVAIFGIAMTNASGTTHNDEFTLEGVPAGASGPLPPNGRSYLLCGDSLEFSVTHTGNTEGAVGAFTMLAVDEDLDIVFSKLMYVQETDLSAP